MLGHPVSEKRRLKRYELRLPVEIVQIAGQPAKAYLHSVNISARGVLVSDPDALLHKGQQVEYLVHLPTGEEGVEVAVHCLGTVVRRDAARRSAAVTLQRYDFVRMPSQSAAAGAR